MPHHLVRTGRVEDIFTCYIRYRGSLPPVLDSEEALGIDSNIPCVIMLVQVILLNIVHIFLSTEGKVGVSIIVLAFISSSHCIQVQPQSWSVLGWGRFLYMRTRHPVLFLFLDASRIVLLLNLLHLTSLLYLPREGLWAFQLFLHFYTSAT